MRFVKYLKKTARTEDKMLFEKWKNKQITTEQCVVEFTNNNSIPIDIDAQDFVEWLDSLGYRRFRG